MQFILFLFLVVCVFSGCFICETLTSNKSCVYSPTNKITGGNVIYGGGGLWDWFRGLFDDKPKYKPPPYNPPLSTPNYSQPTYNPPYNPPYKPTNITPYNPPYNSTNHKLSYNQPMINQPMITPTNDNQPITTHGKTYINLDWKSPAWKNTENTWTKCLFCLYPIYHGQKAYITNDPALIDIRLKPGDIREKTHGQNVIHKDCFKNYLGSHTDTANNYPDIVFKNETWYAMNINMTHILSTCKWCNNKFPKQDSFKCYRGKSTYYHIDCIRKIMNIPELNKPDITDNNNTYTIKTVIDQKINCIQCQEPINSGFYYSNIESSNKVLHTDCIMTYIKAQYTLGNYAEPYTDGELSCVYLNHPSAIERNIDVTQDWYYNQDFDYHPGCLDYLSEKMKSELTLGIRKRRMKCVSCKEMIRDETWYYDKNQNRYSYHEKCYNKYIANLEKETNLSNSS